MKWLQVLAAFLTLLLLVTRSRGLITNFKLCKAPCLPPAVYPGRRRARRGRGYYLAGDDDGIRRDPAIVVEDRHLGDQQCH